MLRTRTRHGYKLYFFWARPSFVYLIWLLAPFLRDDYVFLLFQIIVPKGHIIYPNCIWQVPTVWHTLGFYSALLTKSIGIMPLIMCECASHRFRHKPPNWTLPIKVIFKFTLALKPWLVCKIFFAMFLSHLRIPSLKNYCLIFLHVLTLISSTTWFMNIPRMMNQFIQLIHLFLHSILTVRLTFPIYFIPYFLCFLYATPKLLPLGRARDSRKGPSAENDRRPRRRPGGPKLLKNRRSWPAAPAVHGAQKLSTPRTTGAAADN